MPYQAAGPARQPQVRKVVDANGKKWLVREKASSTPRRPAPGHGPQQPPPAYQQDRTARYEERASRRESGSRQGERAGSAYGERPSRRGSQAPQQEGHQVSQRRSHHQEGSRRVEGSGNSRRPYSEGGYHSQRGYQEDPAVAAERAKRQAKKQKYIKWLMFFVS
ncbi:uncharacterized protein PV07_04284 [Cladophialophora immunda]|uniref:Uncharacterized protein n=1 Tax=Cladophialophora immunda TaxID=569365 RepID=A0A0D2CS11_9EURO|nr:uncharacterized protein PV07_04284 [Cladophialophora immunda]KIW32760.1 hypothetical protein PV07_04284 [Cladophialophora immunda]